MHEGRRELVEERVNYEGKLCMYLYYVCVNVCVCDVYACVSV